MGEHTEISWCDHTKWCTGCKERHRLDAFEDQIKNVNVDEEALR